jgi:glycosyltransferase involved in cell wall biosynthesis
VHNGKNLILYLGRKGGGRQLFNEIELLTNETGTLSIGPTLFSTSENAYGTNWNRTALYIPITALYATAVIIKERKNFGRLVIPMTSWADLLPSAVSLLLRKEVSRVIHDLRIHPGDSKLQVVPLRVQILLSTNLMTLSNYVAAGLGRITKKSIKNIGMYFPRKIPTSRPRIEMQIIFFGRLSKYKGADLLLETLDEFKDELKLVIAGQGEIPGRLAALAVTHINKFLTEEELIDLLCESDIAIFPYIEGSQSGAMAFAATYGCKIVGTNVGGISEFGTARNGFWFSTPDANSLRRALQRAIASKERPLISEKTRAQFFLDMGI